MKAITSFISVLILSVMLMSAGTPRMITGMVVDESGAALAGVNVVEKGTVNGTLTDAQGYYSLQTISAKPVLVFSFIGMETREIQPGATNTLNVTLTASAMELEEVVITGDVSQKHESLCGSVAGVAYNRGRKSMQTAHMAMPAYYAPQQDWNTESYSTIHENGFKDVLHNPLSTFSIDVDRASYSNVRRFINMGQQPPVDAVRIEEMINYFSYDYPEPDGEHPFSVTTTLSTCPWNTGHQLLHIGLQGKHIDKENLPPSNLVFLVDVSGSMNAPNKLQLLKSAFRLLVNELRPQDRVAMVVYAGAAGLVLESTPGNRKTEILEAMDKLQAGGSTAGGAGLKLAYKTAEEHFREEGNNRIILATDGDFNIGQSSDAEMERLIEQKREKGIFITVLGFGMGNYKDSKMETIADKGNGNYAYIDNVQEANKVLVSEFGGTLFTIAKDVKFQIEFNPARVKGYRLVGYENRLLNDEDFNDDTKDAGEMGAGHTVTALYELIPAGAEGEIVDIDPLKYQSDRGVRGSNGNNDVLSAGNNVRTDRTGQARTNRKTDHSGNSGEPYADELMTIKLRYKQPDGTTSTKVEIPVKGKLQKFDDTPDDFRFAAAVAEYGMILRGSDYLEQGSLADVLEMARGARGTDEEGYRGEFIRIVRTTESLLAANK
jgi:Ca-activated chloride channel family protein